MRVRAALIVALAALAACANPAPTRYYTLLAESAPPAAASGKPPDYRVAIGPVSLPEALDRRQIVLRVAPNRYAIADTDRWAEPLKREIPRVIAEDVARQLLQAGIAADSQLGGQGVDYRVLIDVLRFESVPGESIALEAAWSVRDRAGRRLHEANFRLVEKVKDPGVAALVSAHAKALAALAADIATAVRTLARSKK